MSSNRRNALKDYKSICMALLFNIASYENILESDHATGQRDSLQAVKSTVVITYTECRNSSMTFHCDNNINLNSLLHQKQCIMCLVC